MLDSRGEVRIHEVLTEMGLRFEEEYEFPDLVASSGLALRFDFAVFSDAGELLCLLEYQGEQHYTPVAKFGGVEHLRHQRHNDQKKREYCARNGIRLACIPYYEERLIDADYLEEKIYG